MTVSLSPGGLRSYIDSHEMGMRAASDAGPPVQTVFRYGGFVGASIQAFPSLGRAMDYCRSHTDEMEEGGKSVLSGTVVVADLLSGSKGRFSRIWHAPAGGLWGCMILVNTLVAESVNLLPFALGVSCCEAMREAGAETAVVRWVNDVLVDGKKAAGFLVEGYHTPLRLEEYCLLGFGINVNNDEFPEELGPTAISLKQVTRSVVDHDSFCLSYLAKLSWNIGLICYEEQQKLMSGSYSGPGGSHLLVERFKQLSDSIGRRVVYGYDVVSRPQYQATVTDIRNDGALVMRLDDGSEIVEHSGEIRYLQP